MGRQGPNDSRNQRGKDVNSFDRECDQGNEITGTPSINRDRINEIKSTPFM